MTDDFEDQPPRRASLWTQIVVWALVAGLVIMTAGAALSLLF